MASKNKKKDVPVIDKKYSIDRYYSANRLNDPNDIIEIKRTIKKRLSKKHDPGIDSCYRCDMPIDNNGRFAIAGKMYQAFKLGTVHSARGKAKQVALCSVRCSKDFEEFGLGLRLNETAEVKCACCLMDLKSKFIEPALRTEFKGSLFCSPECASLWTFAGDLLCNETCHISEQLDEIIPSF